MQIRLKKYSITPFLKLNRHATDFSYFDARRIIYNRSHKFYIMAINMYIFYSFVIYIWRKVVL